ncbi:MAG: O-antigen ligase family protein [Elusimicrobiota bacterium]
MALAVPVDFSFSLGPLPRLSPIDYFCALAALAWMAHIGPSRAVPAVLKIFSLPEILVWSGFFLFTAMMAIHLGGNVRGPLRWMEFLFFIFLASLAARESPSFTIRYSRVLLWMGSLLSVFGIWQFAHSGGDYRAAVGPFRQHNIQGAFLSLVMPVSFATAYLERGNLRRILWIGAVLMMIAFLAAYSRGAWAGLLAGVAILAAGTQWITPKMTQRVPVLLVLLWIVGSAGLPILAIHHFPGLGSLSNKVPVSTPAASIETERLLSSAQRPIYWRAAYQVIRAHPWVGLGPGKYLACLPQFLDEDSRQFFKFELTFMKRIDFWQHLHSIYLQVLIEYGGIGFLLWALGMALLAGTSLGSLMASRDILAWGAAISVMAFLAHNSVDVLFVNSLDLLLACYLAIGRSSSKPKTEIS